MNLNSSPSPFPAQEISDNDRHHDLALSFCSSSHASCHNFFKSYQDQTVCFDHREFINLQGQSDDNYAHCEGGSSGFEIKGTVESDLELSLWKKEDQGHGRTVVENTNTKWMSSKMRLMEKIKNPPDHVALKLTTAPTSKFEDQKLHPITYSETNQSSCNNSSHNGPIRVCADCNTTKTPLWRSGPKGPKSLCNACGIRQRKARRAMAATAVANGCAAATGATKPPIKVYKEKTGRNIGRPHASQIKKRCKAAVAAVTGPDRSPPNSGPKKRHFEDLLINLSKKLAIHRVFPEDEKDAAILLMALSYGLVHG